MSRSERKLEIFRGVLDSFESDELKDYCKDMIVKIPNVSWVYKKGDLIVKTIQSCSVLNQLLNIKYVKQKIERPKQRDSLRIAMCLYNINEDKTVIANWIKYTKVQHDIKQPLKDYIANLVFLEIEKEEQMLIVLCNCFCNTECDRELKEKIYDFAIDPEEYFFGKDSRYPNMNFLLVYQMDKEYLMELKKLGDAEEPLKTYLDVYL